VTDNTARFELTAAASWVAVGFSSDEKMVSYNLVLLRASVLLLLLWRRFIGDLFC
jgi:hypothetical protein